MNKKGKPPIKEPKEYEEEVIQIDRVTRVVKGGRRLRFRATVVIGNKKGKVGVGVGKSTEVTGAIQKAISQAKKSLINVPITGSTIPHRIKMKYKSARLLLMPACPGTGIIAGGPLRKIIELAGIKDILSKCIGSNNRVINSQATVMALGQLKELPWVKQKLQPKEEEKKEEKPEKEAKKAKAEKSKESAPKTAPKKTESKKKPTETKQS